jgi:hypothetical protein
MFDDVVGEWTEFERTAAITIGTNIRDQRPVQRS